MTRTASILAAALLALAPAAPPGPAPECVRRLNADSWHAAGRRGRGVTVAVLDSGWRGWRDTLGRGLPANLLARSFRNDADLEARASQHGLMCAAVVHALAPDAQVIAANWEPDSPNHFLDAVAWARGRGATVITCSVITPCWSDGEGNGPVHAKLTELLGGRALFFACAGNTARRHWAGDFRDGGHGYHAFAAGRTDNPVTPWGDEPLSVELTWSGDAIYELQLVDESGSPAGRAVRKDAGPVRSAVVRLAKPAGRYRARVKLAGGRPGRFHFVALGAAAEYSTEAGSIPFPGDGPEVVTVGAVDETGRRADYSSCGPNSPTPKPDLAAPVPFPTACRSAPFGGTSAAAPQAAALAALVWSRHPDWTATKVREFLAASARDVAAPGPDAETGFGVLRLP